MSRGGRGAGRLGELVRLFGKLGLVAFGGPAAHIAMFEDEVVERRRWLGRQRFLDLVGATNLIPGPNSTEMAMHVGHDRAGWRGLVVAGASFIVPAVLVTGGFAWLYVEYGTLPAVEQYLYGAKPAVLAVILGALWRLGRTAVKGWRLAVLGAGVAVAVGAGVTEVVALLAGGAAGMAWLVAAGRAAARVRGGGEEAGGSGGEPGEDRPSDGGSAPRAAALPAAGSLREAGWLGAAGGAAAGGVSLWKLGLFFLKVGAVLYGSGYVLVAFLEGDLVSGYGWLTRAELLDAIALGQFTPGPVLSTATFIGYVVAGVPGAVVATAGIFLPSFFFVALLNPLVARLRESRWTAGFLDAVNVSAVGLMAAVLVSLGAGTLTSWPAWAIAAAAGALSVGTRVNAAWLVVGGAIAGALLSPWAGVA